MFQASCSVFSGKARKVTVGRSNVRPQRVLSEVESKKAAKTDEVRSREQRFAVGKRDDGAAGTCPGKSSSLACCHELVTGD